VGGIQHAQPDNSSAAPGKMGEIAAETIINKIENDHEHPSEIAIEPTL